MVKYRKGHEGHGSIVVHCERVQLRRTISSETLVEFNKQAFRPKAEFVCIRLLAVCWDYPAPW